MIYLILIKINESNLDYETLAWILHKCPKCRIYHLLGRRQIIIIYILYNYKSVIYNTLLDCAAITRPSAPSSVSINEKLESITSIVLQIHWYIDFFLLQLPFLFDKNGLCNFYLQKTK